MPALQGSEPPAAMAVAEWLLERITGAHVLPDRGWMRIGGPRHRRPQPSQDVRYLHTDAQDRSEIILIAYSRSG